MRKSMNNAFLVRQLSVNFVSFLITGLALLVIVSVLVLNMDEYMLALYEYSTIYWIFLIIFAVLGLAFLLIGVFLAISSLSVVKKIEIEEEYVLSAPQSAGLNIIRPSTVQKPESEPVKPKTAVKKQEIVKQEPKIAKADSDKIGVSKPSTKAETAIPTDFTYEDGLQSIVDRYNTEKVKKAFKGWYNTMMMTFSDLEKSFLYVINGDEGLEFSEGFDDEAAVKVKMDSDIFVKMMTKQINAIKAYSAGHLEVVGEMKNMLKLRKLMF